MDYLRKLGSFTSTFTFPYTIGECVAPSNDSTDGWELYSGSDKKTSEQVLIHKFSLRNSTLEKSNIAKKTINKCKAIRHPNILRFIYSEQDSEYLTIVTEYAIPLEIHISKFTESDLSSEDISYGLFCLMEGLNFLHNNVKLRHNKLALESVFVTLESEWKLFHLGYSEQIESPSNTRYFNDLICGNPYLACIPHQMSLIDNVDIWAIGCLIYIIYNWKDQTYWKSRIDLNTLKSSSKIPKPLFRNYLKLLTDCNSNISQIINDQKLSPGIFSTQSIGFRSQLRDIYLLNDKELEDFFVLYNQEIKNTTPEIGIFKLLPILTNFFNYGKLLHIVPLVLIQILSKFLKQVSSNDHRFKAANHSQLKDIMIKLFESPGRITRLALLQNADVFLPYIKDKTVISKKIMKHYLQGFTDSCQELQEETVKNISLFVENLPMKEVDDKFMPFICRFIDTTLNMHIMKILTSQFKYMHKSLSSKTTETLLLSFLNKLKLLINRPTHIVHEIMDLLFDLQTDLDVKFIIAKVIPSISHLLLCPNNFVRKQAEKTLLAFIESILNNSENNSHCNDIYYDLTGDHLNQGVPSLEMSSFLENKNAITFPEKSGVQQPISLKISHKPLPVQIETMSQNKEPLYSPTIETRIKNENPTATENIDGWDVDDWDDDTPPEICNPPQNNNPTLVNNDNNEDMDWDDW